MSDSPYRTPENVAEIIGTDSFANRMMLGHALGASGLAFLEARAIHRNRTTDVQEVICETQHDADRVNVWLTERGLNPVARMATEAELKMHKDLVPF